jgi:hypothetical protein
MIRVVMNGQYKWVPAKPRKKEVEPQMPALQMDDIRCKCLDRRMQVYHSANLSANMAQSGTGKAVTL